MRKLNRVTDADYRRLAHFRAALRRFLRFSETAARDAGLSPSQHQLLLLVRGHSAGEPPSIVNLADRLQIRHQSTVGLIDRCERAGLLRRRPDKVDRRKVRIELTPKAERLLHKLTRVHLREISDLRKSFPAA
jgi:DNA-binding MarR family transcriptional regulator